MNYNSLDSVFSSANMVSLKKQNGVFYANLPSWFKINGTQKKTIYVMQNSSFGFDSQEPDLKICSKTNGGYMNYVYSEEGTLYNRYSFFKLHCYSNLGGNTLSYKFEYYVVFWDTGDISVRVVAFPENYISPWVEHGFVSYGLDDLPFDNYKKDFTIYKSDNGGYTKYELINCLRANYLYLIGSNSTYYTIEEEKISPLPVSNLGAQTFEQYGLSDMPALSLLQELEEPFIYCWSEYEDGMPTTGLVAHTVPPLPQVAYSSVDTIPAGQRIDSAIVLDGKDVLVAITIDEGLTWKYWQNATWVNADREEIGMLFSEVKDITSEQWFELGEYSTVQFRFVFTSVDSRGELYYNLSPIE